MYFFRKLNLTNLDFLCWISYTCQPTPVHLSTAVPSKWSGFFLLRIYMRRIFFNLVFPANFVRTHNFGVDFSHHSIKIHQFCLILMNNNSNKKTMTHKKMKWGKTLWHLTSNIFIHFFTYLDCALKKSIRNSFKLYLTRFFSLIVWKLPFFFNLNSHTQFLPFLVIP